MTSWGPLDMQKGVFGCHLVQGLVENVTLDCVRC